MVTGIVRKGVGEGVSTAAFSLGDGVEAVGDGVASVGLSVGLNVVGLSVGDSEEGSVGLADGAEGLSDGKSVLYQEKTREKVSTLLIRLSQENVV